MRHRKYPFIVGFLIIPVVLYVVLVIWPYLQTFGYSLTDWSGASQTMHFIGLRNYTQLFGDSVFRTALLHNMLLLLVLPVVTILLALFFAFMLNVGGRGGTGGVQGARRGVLQGGLLLPAGALGGHPVGALPGGLPHRPGRPAQRRAGQAGRGERGPPLAVAGRPELHPLVRDGRAGLVRGRVLPGALLGRDAVHPEDIYEAALLDGAKRTQTFFTITLPLLWETVQTAWVYLAIAAMDAFALVSTMTPGAYYGGGPNYHSEVMSTYLMRNFITFGKAGYACAMGVVIFFITLILSVVSLRVTRRERIEY